LRLIDQSISIDAHGLHRSFRHCIEGWLEFIEQPDLERPHGQPECRRGRLGSLDVSA